MSALKRLQETAMFQSAGHRSMFDKMTRSAREKILVGVVTCAAAMAGVAPAHAGDIINPSTCAAIGGSIGAIAGGATGKSNAQTAIYSIIGGFAGAVGGNFLCQDRDKEQQGQQGAQYQNPGEYAYGGTNNQAHGGTNNQRFGATNNQQHAPSQPAYRQQRQVSPADIINTQSRIQTEQLSQTRQSLSVQEYQVLDQRFSDVMKKKRAWTESLENVDIGAGDGARRQASLRQEAERRGEFARARDDMARIIFTLASPQHNYDVSVYTGVMASLMEIPTDGSTSIRALQQKEAAMIRANQAYAAEYARQPPTRTSPGI